MDRKDYKDGYYIGEIKNGLPNGFGRFYAYTGEGKKAVLRYEDYFRGLYNGLGRFYDKHKYIEGMFKNGMPVGDMKMFCKRQESYVLFYYGECKISGERIFKNGIGKIFDKNKRIIFRGKFYNNKVVNNRDKKENYDDREVVVFYCDENDLDKNIYKGKYGKNNVQFIKTDEEKVFSNIENIGSKKKTLEIFIDTHGIQRVNFRYAEGMNFSKIAKRLLRFGVKMAER